MRLAKALSIRPGEIIAFVGAGGKSSALFALARELEGPVVLTTTTHLGAWQAGLADEHVVIESSDELPTFDGRQAKVLLITGPAGPDDRLAGLDTATLDMLRERCTQGRITLLIEADGAKLRAMKAPAEYEPVIPRWIDTVVVMAGLGALGQPLTTDWVHRPERFAELSGLAPGDVIRVADVIAVLGSEGGGLKGIPQSARRVLFLNQADSQELASQGHQIARALNPMYDRVLIGSLQQSASDGPVQAALSSVAGVILAAGGSRRLGTSKQLLAWLGKPFISHVIKNSLEAGLAPLIVVTGADQASVSETIRDFPVQIVPNPDWEQGQATSMRAGLSVLPDRCEGVLFLLSDQPQTSPLLIRQLLERFYNHRAPVTAPLVNGQRGNPVLFSRETFTALKAVTGDRGGRAVMNQFEVDWLPWVDDRALLDVDEEDDLARLNRSYFG